MSDVAWAVFKQCVEAINASVFIHQSSPRDKEFHFQDWFQARLQETGMAFEQAGRNEFPDFRMVASAEGFEIKGLAYPGRETSYDSNSQIPRGFHNGRAIYYVFGRYPAQPDGSDYPVIDLVICHGDFLNVDRDYTHLNRSVQGFGSYGDILIRDRKMYVAPTPFALADGIAHHQTLILPAYVVPAPDAISVGTLTRTEAQHLIVGYDFDLTTNVITPHRRPNPDAGKPHMFQTWRRSGAPTTPVVARNTTASTLASASPDIRETDDVQ